MKQTTALKKPAEVRKEFDLLGISIAEWSRTHKVSRQLVYEILAANPRRSCSRGASHRIAVLLGIKAGELAKDVRDINAAGMQRAR